MAEITQPEFGRKLSALRRERGLTQRQLAGTTVTASYVSLLEAGVRVPTLDVVVRLARTLQVPLADLIGADEDDIGTRPTRRQPADAGPPTVVDPGTPIPSGAERSTERMLSAVLARSAMDVGDLQDARHRYLAAFEHARAEHNDAQMVEYGMAVQEIYRLQDMAGPREELLGIIDPCVQRLGVPELLAKVHSERAAAARDNGHLFQALELARLAVREASTTALKGTGEYVRMLGILVSAQCETGRTAGVVAVIEEMLGCATAVGGQSLVGRAHWVAAMAYLRIKRPELVAPHVQSANDALISASTPMHDWARFARVAAATLLDVGAAPEEVARYLRNARAASAVVDLPAERGPLQLLEARVALTGGDPEPALELGVPDPATPIPHQVQWHLVHGRGLLAAGRLKDAREEILRAAEMADQHELFQLASQVWRELDTVGR